MTTRAVLAAVLASLPAWAFSAAPAAATKVPPAATAPKTDAAKGDSGVAKKSAPTAPAKKTAEPEGASALLKVPFLSPRFASTPVAVVDGDVITMGQLVDTLALEHAPRSPEEGATGEEAAPAAPASRSDFTRVLERLIDTRVVASEARDMGIDDLPQLKEELAKYEETALRKVFEQTVSKDVKADPAAVERIFQDSVREWKLRSIVLDKEEDAKAVAPLVRDAKAFEETAKRLVAEKKARGNEEPVFVPESKLLPQIEMAVAALKPGQVSPPVKIPSGWTVIKVVDVRYPEDPEARAIAEERALAAKRREAVIKAYEALAKKYATVDEKLIDRLDYEAKKPGWNALYKDKRVLAKIRGEAPITVGDLAAGISLKFFHGMEGPIRANQVNVVKRQTFEGMLMRRLFKKEALAQKLDQSEEYKAVVAEYETSLLFGMFVQRAVVPSVKVTEGELMDYYEKHKAEFSTPAFYRLDALAFRNGKAAQAALDKIKSGTDLKWLKSNAADLVPAEERDLDFGGTIYSAKGLPEELAKLLAGAKKGEFRLYSSRGGQAYVVQLLDVTPGKEQPYKESRETIGKKVFASSVEKALKEWVAKLRKEHDVKVYITRVDG
ncbi:peptidyl-prolyl cis-trans isomerase [Anaeromyxobacter sp. SG66]|uniref:peptidyl-prolyl cis-trans isomerase n=1 Tax=Anaeromyxobacter sp. SG66 TaxID=2925410 RepID=UPI001F57D9DA|nr:peptidyl-prolyl cis-trans isomerase [Anaeromyxobacter sp. SG66]